MPPPVIHSVNATRATSPADLPKYYILDMFPYPSGAGLHVGHPEGYTATDILARYKRMKGFNVLHPIGWDAFGLPAEQYAIKTGQHPRITTETNVSNFKRQIQSLGFGTGWSREIDTTDPKYFRWTQWIFLQLYNSWFNPETNSALIRLRRWLIPTKVRRKSKRAWRDEHRLAFVSEGTGELVPELGTVLANQEVKDGVSEVRAVSPVERKPMRQWMLRITAYAQRLLDDLDGIEWSDSLKEMQRNWIGRSEGAEVVFKVEIPTRRSPFSPRARTRCSARRTWFFRRRASCWTRSFRTSRGRGSLGLKRRGKATSSGSTWPRTKPG